MESDLSGTWKLDKYENLDEYMSAQKIGYMKRKAAMVLKPTLKITGDGNRFSISENFVGVSVSNEFTVGDDFELLVRPNGQKANASSRMEGNKLILEGAYIDDDKSPFKIVRYIENDRLVEESHFKDVVCTRWFKGES